MDSNGAIAGIVIAIAAVIGLVIWSPWSSSDGEHSKADLLSRVNAVMEENDAPPPLTRCFVGTIERAVSEAEVQRAYDSLPEGADTGELRIADLPPDLYREVSGIGLLCIQRLLRSGRFQPEEIRELLRGFSE